MRVRRTVRFGVATAAIVVFAALLAPGALASSGQINEAIASPDWSSASITGSVTWNGCEPHGQPKKPDKPDKPGESPKGSPSPRYCGWIPFLTVGPGSIGAGCNSPQRLAPESSPGVTLSWLESEKVDQGTAYFSVSEVSLDGVDDLLICLAVIEVATDYESVCMIPEHWECPANPYPIHRFPHVLDSVRISRPTEGAVAPAVAPPAPKKKRGHRNRGRGAKFGRLQVHRNVAVS
jgi:hypothetical protein